MWVPRADHLLPRLSRNLYFARQRQSPRPPDAAGGGDTSESTDAGHAGAGADVRHAATDERAGGAHSGSATGPRGPSGNVDANLSRATADEHAGGNSGEHQDTVSGEVPVRRSPGPDGPGRYPPGNGEEPLPDYQVRASWHLISTHGAQMRPKAGEVWRFLVGATPGSMEAANKRWVQVLIPPGQQLRLFAARPELRFPGAAPITYVDDPSPVTAPCWYDEDENGPGYYSRVYSLPRLVLDAWGRSPAQGAAVTAAAEARAKVDLDMLTHWPRHDRSLLQSSRPRYPSPYGVAA